MEITDIEKEQNAEFSTPIELCNEMIDLLPKDYLKNPNVKILEPSSGKGNFLISLRNRGVNQKNIFYCDINPRNIEICKLLGFENGVVCDALTYDFKKQFDLIIGNPPYSTNPSKNDTTPLYNLFVETFINECDYMLFVLPSRWFIGGKGLNNFRKMMMNRTDIKYITHEDNAKKWFGNHVEIKGGVSYFLKNKFHNGNCLFNSIEYKLNKYDCVIKPKYHSIIDKIKQFDSIDKIYNSSGFYKIRTNDKQLKKTGNIKCYVSKLKSKDRCKYINDFDFNKKNTFWKVITPRASHGAFSGFGEIFIGQKNELHTDSYINFKINSRDEALSLMSYLKTDFVNYMLSIRKISQDISKNTCKWIPLIPFDRIWTNDMIYNHFNITKNEIDLINSTNKFIFR